MAGIARYFIDRPIFAIVISLFLVLAGTLSLMGLPISQYPDIALPTVRVTTLYPGASADIVEEGVSMPLDTMINGVTDMKSIKSVSGDDGSSSISVTFELERDPDQAAVETQNRVSQVMASLPSEVKDIGVTVRKASPDTLMYMALYSPKGEYNRLFLGNYLNNYLLDEFKRVKGVGDVQVFGSEFGMRVWLKPDRMAALGVSVPDVVAAVREQNKQVAAGQVGQPPAQSDTGLQYSLRMQGRLVDAEQFRDIIIRARPDGASIHLGDIARVELDAEGYGTQARFNGREAAGLGISLSPGANAMETAELVKHKLEELSKSFPAGMQYQIVYDTSLFVEESIAEVVKTFEEALVLVLLVVFLFLQSWRATLIPMVAVPVSLVATFIAYQFLGFSINTLSLFGMVLAIGIVVDDAIVVVEAVEHKMDHEGLSAREATRAAMDEVSGPVIAIALVLSAVFVPMAFVPGVTGQLYKQFALTIAVSTMFSALVALTLTPALCSLLLVPKDKDKKPGPLGRFFAAFNRRFARLTERYLGVAGFALGSMKRLLLAMLLLLIALVLAFRATPSGFVPDEDQGAFFMHVALPEAASTQRTQQVLAELTPRIQALSGVAGVMSVSGFDLMSTTAAPNAGLLIVQLKPWADREDAKQKAAALVMQATMQGMALPEALSFAFNPPALPGFGAMSGFSMMLQARAGQTPEELAATTQAFLLAAGKRPEIGRITTTFGANTPNYQLEVDREKVKKQGIRLDDVFSALQVNLGSLQVNDFTLAGRNYKVVVQADADYRRDIGALSKLYVRNSAGSMVPLDTLVSAKPGVSARYLTRYNLYRTAEISGTPAAGYSSGQALEALRETAAQVLGPDYGYEWAGQTREEVETGNAATMVLLLSVVVVFLFLAALYESWSIPLAVLLAVPFGILGAMLGLKFTGTAFDVYGQIGLVTLIGLAAKNAILIVEFANLYREQGMPLREAALKAAELRLRPIIMTSFAFILGVVPLVLASGAGAASKHSVGIAVFSGMLTATLLAVIFVPALYVLVRGASERFFGNKDEQKKTPDNAPGGQAHA